MQKITLLGIILFLLLPYLPLPAQPIQWITFEALNDSLRAHPKPILIFIHADWCKYCALQDRNTFRDETVSRLLNKQYYALRLNAEETAAITFFNRTYYRQSVAYHELAEFLGRTGRQLAFPTTVILSQDLQLQEKLVGFVAADDLRLKIGRQPTR